MLDQLPLLLWEAFNGVILINVFFCLVIRQKKYLEAMLGGEDDGMQDDDDDEDDEEDHKPTIGGRQFSHGADNRNFEVKI